MFTRHPRYFVPVRAGERFVHLNGRVFYVTRGRYTGTTLVFGYSSMAEYHQGTSRAFWTYNGHRFPVRSFTSNPDPSYLRSLAAERAITVKAR